MTSETMENTETLSTRLKAARNAKKLSRRELSEITNIPAKSIEQYEYGGLEPNISRLYAISDALEVSLSTLIGIESEILEGAAEPTFPTIAKDTNSAFLKECLLHAHELDVLRKNRYLEYPTKARAHYEGLHNAIRYLDFGDMKILAEHRGLIPLVDDAINMGEFALRIIDTAVFGIDFYSIKLNALSSMAEEYSLSPKGRLIWQNWRDHDEIIEEIRDTFCEQIFEGGDHPDFEDQEAFPSIIIE